MRSPTGSWTANVPRRLRNTSEPGMAIRDQSAAMLDGAAIGIVPNSGDSTSGTRADELPDEEEEKDTIDRRHAATTGTSLVRSMLGPPGQSVLRRVPQNDPGFVSGRRPPRNRARTPSGNVSY